MTTTAIIVATIAADTSVVGTILDGASKTFGTGLLGPFEKIDIEQKNSSGGYTKLWYLTDSGMERQAQLKRKISTIKLSGPLDFRINKPVTRKAVEVVEYT